MKCEMKLLSRVRTRIQFCTYTTLPNPKPATRLPRKTKLKNTVSLDHFIQRGKVLSLWRRIVRDCTRIKDSQTRRETLGFAREEFERHRGISDIGHIRYLLSTGKTQWDTMGRYIYGL